MKTREAFDAFRCALETGYTGDFLDKVTDDFHFFVPLPLDGWNQKQEGRERFEGSRLPVFRLYPDDPPLAHTWQAGDCSCQGRLSRVHASPAADGFVALPFVFPEENKKHPAITIIPPTPCIHVSCSPRNRKAKGDVKIGLKLRKMPDVVAPSFCTPMFHSTMHTTVEITPVYNREPTKDAFRLDTVKSARLKGTRIASPKTAE